MIRIAEKLSGPLGRSVRGDGLDIEILFRGGNSLIFSINCGGSRNKVIYSCYLQASKSTIVPRMFTSWQGGAR